MAARKRPAEVAANKAAARGRAAVKRKNTATLKKNPTVGKLLGQPRNAKLRAAFFPGKGVAGSPITPEHVRLFKKAGAQDYNRKAFAGKRERVRRGTARQRAKARQGETTLRLQKKLGVRRFFPADKGFGIVTKVKSDKWRRRSTAGQVGVA